MSHPSYGLNELREKFLTFFESKDHLRLPSFSLIPQNDKSILLINAGMTPMKAWFKGEEEPPRRRVCTCQKCIRTGDIDNVGHTARHGTYFEMLGNFSFGDYFKHEAIAWSWEFLTKWADLEPDRLYPSVYQDDDEAFAIWRDEIGIPEDRIFRFGKEDNFWEHGSGPCGPCSEIYYDRGEKYGCGKPGCTVGCDCDRYVEVWNNVFSQFDNDGHGNYTELKQKNIDTGMGLERLAMVSQCVDSIFDVDTVMHITNRVSELTGAHYGESHARDVSLRVITDHIRSATFMICDGVLPSNEGRGYVLRRLLRRAARHGKLLGVNEPFLYEIVDTVVRVNEGEYHDVREKQEYITRVIRTEEENFARTIDGGMKIFADLLAAHRARAEKRFSGADAFRLYDTYGFPIDLTIEMARDEGLDVDEEGYRREMEEQKTRAREARKALGDLGWAGVEFGKEVPATEFVGYDKENLTGCAAKVVALVVEGEQAEQLMPGVEGIVVLDRTPFYAEMGGQVADHGVITTEDGAKFAVTDVQKNKGGKYMHYGTLELGALRLGDSVSASIDTDRRQAIARAHTATHLLDKALRTVLGDHVNQAGSLVEPDRVRFDFTHFSAMSAEELTKVSKIVNRAILAGYDVQTEEMPIAQARERGAIALFGEKYGDIVRVVSIGEDGWSRELCGGTHIDHVGKIGAINIMSEASIGSGVRRVDAVVGQGAYEFNAREHALVSQLSDMVNARPDELAERVNMLLAKLKESDRRLAAMYESQLAASVPTLVAEAKASSAPVKVAKKNVGHFGSFDALRKTVLDVRGQLGEDAPVVVALAGMNEDGKPMVAVATNEAARKQGIKAGDLVRGASKVLGGGGGGKPDFAQGGGADATKIDEALEALAGQALKG